MSDQLEQAASAFDDAMGVGQQRSEPRGKESSRPTEQLFGGLGELEVDEDSPAQGGGDNKPTKDEMRQQRRIKEKGQEDETLSADSFEDEDEEADGSAEDEETSDEDEGGKKDGDEGDDDFYEVMVDGVRTEVSLKEALDGYIRQDTFHKRMNYLGEVKKQLVSEAENAIQMRNDYVAKLQMADKLLEAIMPQEPDWAAEYTADPVAAKALQDNYQRFQKQREQIQAEVTRAKGEGDKKAAEDNVQYIREQNDTIMRNNPAWKDPKVRERDLKAMGETARNAGFSDEEVMATTDSRMITILKKAMLYDKISAARPKPIRRGPQPAKPGAGNTRTAPKGIDKAQKQLRKTGSVNDAAAVFANLIK